jgi:hypothetical protein
MNRRTFLGTVGGSLAVAMAAHRADAFVVEECTAESSSSACRELLRHRDVVVQLDAMLKEHGLSDEERQAVLAAAMCPFCGESVVSADLR